MHINFLVESALRVDGYGTYGMNLLRALTRRGVSAMPMDIEQVMWEGWVQRLAGFDFSRLTLGLMSGGSFMSIPGRLWGATMFESTKLPDGWAENLNTCCERIIVPSPWLVDVFYKSGIKKHIPIHVVGGGVDPHEFPYIQRPLGQRPYTFMCLGDRHGRKGDDIAVQAFFIAFGEKPRTDVRMVIKARRVNHKQLDLSRNPKWLSVWREDLDRMADALAQADCYTFPSKSEGWGLPPREAASTGLPVITTNWGGTAVGIENWAIPLNDYKITPSPLGGEWVTPNVEEVADKMRWCFEHQEEAAEIGRKASVWLHTNQSWDCAAQDWIALMEQYA